MHENGQISIYDGDIWRFRPFCKSVSTQHERRARLAFFCGTPSVPNRQGLHGFPAVGGLQGRCGGHGLFGQELPGGNDRLLHCATHRPAQAVLGHRHRLYRLADNVGPFVQPGRVPAGGNNRRGRRNGSDHFHVRRRAGRLRRRSLRMDRPVPLPVAAGPNAARLCLCAGRLHGEPNRVSRRRRSGRHLRYGLVEGARDRPGRHLRRAGASIHPAQAYNRPVHWQAFRHAERRPPPSRGCDGRGARRCDTKSAGISLPRTPRPPHRQKRTNILSSPKAFWRERRRFWQAMPPSSPPEKNRLHDETMLGN